ncbi:MAG: hypothetical protein ACRCUJ_04375 [Phocaeicola sp.]
MDKYESIVTIVKKTDHGTIICVDDLLTCCRTIEELADASILAYKKGCKVICLKQPWYSTDSTEVGAILLIKIVQFKRALAQRNSISLLD